MAGGKAKASKAAAVQEPSGWLTVNQALSWIAFRSLAQNWDTAFYFGASLWFTAAPSEIAEWLEEAVSIGRVPVYQVACSADELEAMVAERAYELRREALGKPSSDGPMTIRAAAQVVLAKLHTVMDVACEQHEAIWDASERLRRGIASGAVQAAGSPGTEGYDDDEPEPPPLQPIPREVCAVPVTLAHGGILGFTRGDRIRDGYRRLWSRVRIDARSLLEAEAALTSATQSVPHRDPKSTPRNFSKAALGAWFTLHRHTRDPKARQPTEADDRAAAEAYFGMYIPRDEFREIRRVRVPAEQRKPGRPRKA